MRWDWATLQATPVSVVAEIVCQMKDEAERQQRQAAAARRR
jgi:hypothetical protein